MQQSRQLRAHRRLGAALSGVVLWATHATAAEPARPTHIVRQGETLGAIALRHHVSLATLRAKNGLADTQGIRVGQALCVPATPAEGAGARVTVAGVDESAGKRAKAVRPTVRMKAGIVRLVRGSETLQTRVLDRHRKLVANKLPEFARLLRSSTGAQHDIDPRLVALLSAVSDHFGGRELTVVSGFRPYSSRQFTAHSNHNVGRAIDFTIAGVSNEALRDFCRTLRNVGVGYYPNSSFVHMDVRATSTFWIDYAGPGQTPRYHRAESKLDADEGAGEVEQVPSIDDPAGVGHDGPASKPWDPATRGAEPGAPRRDATGSESVFPTR